MVKKAIEILIEADDQASKKLQAVTANVEKNVKQIKDVGGKAKASTEFIGTLASSLGGSEIGSYASQLAGLTEKVSQFSEVSKLGAAGALAFKAGLAGAVGAAAFQVGQAIGNVVFETERWADELAKAKQRAFELNDELREMKRHSRDMEKREIALLPVGEQQSAIDGLRKSLASDMSKYKEELEKAEAEVKRLNSAFTFSNAGAELVSGFGSKGGGLAGGVANFAAEVGEANAKAASGDLTALETRIHELKGLIADSKQEIKSIDRGASEQGLLNREAAAAHNQAVDKLLENMRQTNELAKENGAALYQLQAEYKGLNEEQAKRYVALSLEAEHNKALASEKAQLEQLRKKEGEASQRESERVKNIIDSEIRSMEEQRISLQQGKEAAHAYRLEMQGIAKEEALRIAALQARIDGERELKESMARTLKEEEKRRQLGIENEEREKAAHKDALRQPLQAFSSRFLTRGLNDNIPQKQLTAAEDTAKASKEQLEKMKELIDVNLRISEEMKANGVMRFRVV